MFTGLNFVIAWAALLIVAVMYDTTDHKISAIVCFLISLGFGVGAIMQ